MQRLNPFGGTDPEVFETVLDTGVKVFLTKEVKHVFNDGDRVVVHAPGHFHHGKSGKVVDSRSDTRIRVHTDDGHELTAAHHDLIPESLAPVAESVKVLKCALDSGAVSVHDRVQIEICLEKASTGDFAMSPFGELHSNDPFAQLRIYASKYAPAALRKGNGVTVGRLARHVPSGKIGRPTRFYTPPGSTFSSPKEVWFVPEGASDGLGYAVLLADLVPADDGAEMSLDGRIRVSTEARPDPETNARGERETQSARDWARRTGNKAAWRNPMLVEDDNVLAKRSGDSFKIGDLVKELVTGRKGKITRLDVTHADIDYGNGVTGICLLGHFVPAA